MAREFFLCRRAGRVCARAVFVALLLWPGAMVWGEDAWRDDFDDVRAWQARPEWLSPHAENPVASAGGGVGRFTVPTPGTGMKWSRSLDEPLDIELAPWLVIRYRAAHYDVDKPDYVVWLKDSRRGRDGVRVLLGDGIQVDGQWHTLAVYLPDCDVSSPITQIALQCYADESGPGVLEVDYVACTDLLPEDAVELHQPEVPVQAHVVELAEPGAWTAQPTWLGNYTPGHDQLVRDGVWCFSVQDGNRGTKWSHELDVPIRGARYVVMRYRGRHLRRWDDYVLYVSSGGGPAGLQEQYLIRENQIAADGQWQVAVARVTVPEIRSLAVQVQAAEDDACLEIAELRFQDQRPVIALADTFPYTPGWSAPDAGWRAVALPPGNQSGAELVRRMGLHGWIPEGPLTASGIPLQVQGGRDAVLMTPLGPPGQISIPLTGQASEAYLLLAALFPLQDEPSYAGATGQVRHVHRFVARIAYTDGTSEDQFPLAVDTRTHAISRALHTYALALDPARTLQELTLVDSMRRGAFGLVALTLSDTPGPATVTTQLRPATSPPPARQPIEVPAVGITCDGPLLTVSAESMTLALRVSSGLRVEQVTNRSGAGLEAAVRPGPLFRVLGDGFEVNSEEFVVTRVTTAGAAQDAIARIELNCDKISPPVQVSVQIDVRDPREIGLQASIELNGQDPAKTRFLFPELQGITFGGEPSESWVWCPRRGDVITAANVFLREPYAGAGNPLQIIGAFDPARGAGLYLMTQDLEALSKFYQVQKTVAGARLAIEYTPLHDAELPRSVLGCQPGDWHQQLERYRQWVQSWYQPAAPRKRWFREVWNFRQQFLHFALPTKSGIFHEDTRTIRLQEVVEADAEAFGGVDYLHLFDWGWDPVHGRCGDYEPWDYLGGVDNFRSAVEEVQAAGIPVGLYLEGILVDPQSNLGRAHGAAWQMLGPAGQPYGYFAPSFHICPRVPQWQAYLSGTYRRVRAQTGAVGFYVDEYGFSGPTYWCYNPDHDHPVPVTPVLGEREMLKQVRAALGPDAAIYTEESPTDVNSQYQDGSFTYNISSVPDDWSPSHVNLYRFAFPTFKTIEIICCDQPLGTNVEAVKRCLFNGEAIWIEGIRDQWFAPEVRAQIALNRRVLRENRECFAGDDVEPLVPTLLSGLYANRFHAGADSGAGKTCWTVYNTNYRTVSAEVMAVQHHGAATYRNEVTGELLAPRVSDGQAFLTLQIPPRDVIVVSQQ